MGSNTIFSIVWESAVQLSQSVDNLSGDALVCSSEENQEVCMEGGNHTSQKEYRNLSSKVFPS